MNTKKDIQEKLIKATQEILQGKEESIQRDILYFLFPRQAYDILGKLQQNEEPKKPELKKISDEIQKIILDLNNKASPINSSPEEKKTFSTLLFKAKVLALFVSENPLSEEDFLNKRVNRVLEIGKNATATLQKEKKILEKKQKSKKNLEEEQEPLNLLNPKCLSDVIKKFHEYHNYVLDLLTLINVVKSYRSNENYSPENELKFFLNNEHFNNIIHILTTALNDIIDKFNILLKHANSLNIATSAKTVESIYLDFTDILKLLKNTQAVSHEKTQDLNNFHEKIVEKLQRGLKNWLVEVGKIVNNANPNNYKLLLDVKDHLSHLLTKQYVFSFESYEKIFALASTIKDKIRDYESIHIFIADTPKVLQQRANITNSSLLKMQLLQQALYLDTKEHCQELLKSEPKSNKENQNAVIIQSFQKALESVLLDKSANNKHVETQLSPQTQLDDIEWNAKNLPTFSNCYSLLNLYKIKVDTQYTLLKYKTLTDQQKSFIEEQMRNDILEGAHWLLRCHDIDSQNSNDKQHNKTLIALANFFYEKETELHSENGIIPQENTNPPKKSSSGITSLRGKFSSVTSRSRSDSQTTPLSTTSTDSLGSSSSVISAQENIKPRVFLQYVHALVNNDNKVLQHLYENHSEELVPIEKRKGIKSPRSIIEAVHIQERAKKYLLNNEELNCPIMEDAVNFKKLNRNLQLLNGHADCVADIFSKINKNIHLSIHTLPDESFFYSTFSKIDTTKIAKSLRVFYDALVFLVEKIQSSQQDLEDKNRCDEASSLNHYLLRITNLQKRITHLQFTACIHVLLDNFSRCEKHVVLDKNLISLHESLTVQSQLIKDFNMRSQTTFKQDEKNSKLDELKSTYSLCKTHYKDLKENLILWEMASLAKNVTSLEGLSHKNLENTIQNILKRFSTYAGKLADLKKELNKLLDIKELKASPATEREVKDLLQKVENLEFRWFTLQGNPNQPSSSNSYIQQNWQMQARSSLGTLGDGQNRIPTFNGNPIVVMGIKGPDFKRTKENLDPILHRFTEMMTLPALYVREIAILSANPRFFFKDILIDSAKNTLSYKLACVLELMTLLLLGNPEIKTYIPPENLRCEDCANCENQKTCENPFPDPWENLQTRNPALCTRDAIIEVFECVMPFPEQFLDLCKPPKGLRNNGKPITIGLGNWKKGSLPAFWSTGSVSVSAVDKDRNRGEGPSLARVRAATCSNVS